ncbi:MAG TPA: ribose 5-phosphate isomerase B [Abditibacteriaceae bacterium]|jgi:ribose 5-phosphate isomerase B
MKIAIGSDHAGFELKERIKQFLGDLGHEVLDKGTDSSAPTPYAPFCFAAARAVVSGEAERAIVLGGSGNGEAITANRVRGVRCALCWNLETARLSRLHNDANCISIGARMVDEALALQIVQTWLETPFEGGRHIERIRLIDELMDENKS